MAERSNAPRFLLNRSARERRDDRGPFDDVEYGYVRRFFERDEHGHPTPLHSLPHRSAELGIRKLFVKDESERFGMNAFKIVGVTFAVLEAYAIAVSRAKCWELQQAQDGR